jgi:hypothetical protein
MDLYVILRRGGWRSPEELQEAAARSTAEGERMPNDIRWIRSYVLEEGEGLGTVCIYEASSPRRCGRPAGHRDRQSRRHGDRAARPGPSGRLRRRSR